MFKKRSFSKRTGMFRALTTEKELELNDPLSNLPMRTQYSSGAFKKSCDDL